MEQYLPIMYLLVTDHSISNYNLIISTCAWYIPLATCILLIKKRHKYSINIYRDQGLCDRSPRIAKSPRKPLANTSYANLGVIEALTSTDARRGTC